MCNQEAQTSLHERASSGFQTGPPSVISTVANSPAASPPRAQPPLVLPVKAPPLAPDVLAKLLPADLDVSAEERSKLTAVLSAHSQAFAQNDFDLGKTTLLEHEIDTGESLPFKIKCRPVPFKTLEWLKGEIERLLKLNVIRPSNSPYSSPIVIVPKKSGPNEPPKFRLCVDYRWLNEQTKKDAHPLPRICDILPSLGQAKYFTSLDLVSGYHQVPMAQSSIEKTAFSTPFGHYEYTTMPFGLSNAPATFQRLMNNIFRDRVGRDLFVYLDDIIVYSPDLDSHIRSLHEVFGRIESASLKCQREKCQIAKRSLTYLGHTVSAEGLSPETRKLDALRDWALPTSGNSLLSFLGFCNYYHPLVERFAEYAVPLYGLAKQEKIEWSDEDRTRFESLRQAVITAPILCHPDLSKPFLLETDASAVAMGAVLKQRDETSEWPVMFFSHSLSKAERNYSTYERELLAFVRSVQHFAIYLLYNPFVWRTDHAALRNLFRSDLKLSSRVSRWILALQPYKFSIELIKGKDNQIADALSRMSEEGLQVSPFEPAVPDAELDFGTLPALCNAFPLWSFERSFYKEFPDRTPDCLPALPVPSLRSPGPIEHKEILRAQEADPAVARLREQVKNGDAVAVKEFELNFPAYRILMAGFAKLSLRNRLLYVQDLFDPTQYRIIVPPSLVDRVLEFAHFGPDVAHPGAKRLKEKIQHLYYWPTLKMDVKVFAESCSVCELFRPRPRLRLPNFPSSGPPTRTKSWSSILSAAVIPSPLAPVATK